MKILGLDPGLDGGVALLADGNLLLRVMPVRQEGGKRRVDAERLAELLRSWKPDEAVLERVGAMPGQGVSSMFTFGKCVGTVVGVLAALQIPVVEVQPRVWQRAVLGSVPAGSPKERALLRARELWPAESWLATPRSRKPHDGLVDAALLAQVGSLAARQGKFK